MQQMKDLDLHSFLIYQTQSPLVNSGNTARRLATILYSGKEINNIKLAACHGDRMVFAMFNVHDSVRSFVQSSMVQGHISKKHILNRTGKTSLKSQVFSDLQRGNYQES
jgi:hypothetical protein